MAFTKVVILAAVVAFASAAPQLQAASDEFDPNPSYDFQYSINDPLTGDSKTQQESLSNGAVSGSYSLVEPDGTRRIVDYTADDVNGFNAVVRKEGNAVPAPAPARIAVARPVAVARPTITVAHAAPVVTAYHAPTVAVAHAPAVAYHAAPAAVLHAAPAVAYHAPAAVAYHAAPAATLYHIRK